MTVVVKTDSLPWRYLCLLIHCCKFTSYHTDKHALPKRCLQKYPLSHLQRNVIATFLSTEECIALQNIFHTSNQQFSSIVVSSELWRMPTDSVLFIYKQYLTDKAEKFRESCISCTQV